LFIIIYWVEKENTKANIISYKELDLDPFANLKTYLYIKGYKDANSLLRLSWKAYPLLISIKISITIQKSLYLV